MASTRDVFVSLPRSFGTFGTPCDYTFDDEMMGTLLRGCGVALPHSDKKTTVANSRKGWLHGLRPSVLIADHLYLSHVAVFL